MAHYSVFGADGFVGSSLVKHLRDRGHYCDPIGRHGRLPASFGHLVFCIGVSSDFRSRPFDTIDAHVSALVPLLRAGRFESFTYLSSTRVYQGLPVNEVADENVSLMVNPGNADDLYNVSKLAGESLCLTMRDPAIRVVRLSNVYGAQDKSDNFLTTILRQVLSTGRATFFNSLSSRKDYVSIDDVVQSLELIPLRASSRIINLASGQNVSNGELRQLILRHAACEVDVRADASEIQFPPIGIDRLTNELGVHPKNIADEFSDLVRETRLALVGIRN